MKPLGIASYVSLALLLIFCGLAIVASTAERKLSALGSRSIAPENLSGAAERFRLNLVVEQNTEIRESMSESEPEGRPE